jgi:hypothetical protein
MQEAPAHREANAVRARLGGQFAVDVAERLRRRAMDEDNQVVAARDALAALPKGQAPNIPLQLPHRRALPVVGHQVGMDIQDLPATQDERQGDRVRGQQQAEFEREPLLRVPEEQVMVQAFGAAWLSLMECAASAVRLAERHNQKPDSRHLCMPQVSLVGCLVATVSRRRQSERTTSSTRVEWGDHLQTSSLKQHPRMTEDTTYHTRRTGSDGTIHRNKIPPPQSRHYHR